MKTLSMAALALVIGTPALAGEPVLVPDFTPGTTSEFTLASLLQDATFDALARSGHVVLSNEVVASVVGPLDACADTPSCPHDALSKLPTRFAVVVTVRRQGDNVFGDVALYEQSSRDALDRRTVQIMDGDEGAFGREVADLINDMSGVMGPADARDLIAAARLISDHEDGPTPATGKASDPDPEPAPGTGPKPPSPVERPVGPLSDEARLAQALDGTGYTTRHLVGVKAHFLDSGLDVRDWAYRATPHAGRAIIEVRAGLGLGDTDRTAYVRTALGDGEPSLWFQEGPTPGQRMRGELFVGYAPSAYVDVGAMLGLQYGQRTLDSGWADASGGGDSSVDQVQAVQFQIQPRVRVYPVVTGPVKPYVLAGMDFRVFDQWRISDVDNISYAQPPGGFVPGPTGGVGILVDPSPMVGFFVDAAFTYHLGVRSVFAQNAEPRPANANDFATGVPAGYTLGLAGGVQFRL